MFNVVQIGDILDYVSKWVTFVITPLGSYQIDRWMFLYEAYFVLLPTCIFSARRVGTGVWVNEV